MTNNDLQRRSASYRLAALDQDFLLGDSMRGVRFLLEYAKAEEPLRAWGVRSTIVVFGSARIMPGGERRSRKPRRRRCRPRRCRGRSSARRAGTSEARRFGRIASERGGALQCRKAGCATTSSPPAAGRRHHGGGQPRRFGGRRALDRLQHPPAARAGAQRLLDAGADLPLPLLRHAEDASRDARQRAGRLSRRLRHAGRAVRDPHPAPDRQVRRRADRAVRRAYWTRSSTSMPCSRTA